MKLNSNKKQVAAFAVICQYGYTIEFENPVTQKAVRKGLESLIIKLHRANGRITRTFALQFDPYQTLVLYWCCEWWIELRPESLEAVTAREFINTATNE